MKTLVALGDSWTYGSELNDRNHAWPNRLAEKIGCTRVVNLGQEASSIYHLPLQVSEFEKMDITNPVFVVGITDEARIMLWNNAANDWHKLTGVPELARNSDLTNYLKEFATTVDTFAFREYNLGMTITWLQNYFSSHGFQYVMFKQFNDIKTNFFDHMIDKSTIHRGGNSILRDLASHIMDFSPIGDTWTFREVVKDNQYFQGNIAHPNELGHVKIAELLEELYNGRYYGI